MGAKKGSSARLLDLHRPGNGWPTRGYVSDGFLAPDWCASGARASASPSTIGPEASEPAEFPPPTLLVGQPASQAVFRALAPPVCLSVVLSARRPLAGAASRPRLPGHSLLTRPTERRQMKALSLRTLIANLQHPFCSAERDIGAASVSDVRSRGAHAKT